MKLSNLVRWCGLMVVLGGPLCVAQGIFSLFELLWDVVTFNVYRTEALPIFGLLGVLAAIAGLHARQRAPLPRRSCVSDPAVRPCKGVPNRECYLLQGCCPSSYKA